MADISSEPPKVKPLEAAARALCAALGIDPDLICHVSIPYVVGKSEGRTAPTVQRPSEGFPAWHRYRAQARAAIAALREPSAAMIRAGHRANDSDWDGPRPRDAVRVWRAMVDALLEGRR